MQRILKQNPRKVIIYDNKPRSAARGATEKIKRCYCSTLLILMTAVGGRPKPELCFLPERLM